MTAVSEGARVTPLELFFDLVFVYAITQVVAMMARDDTAHGLLNGMLVTVLLWWCWSGYAWLGNQVRADDGATRLGLFGVMAAMFVVALTIPEAFDDLPGGLNGPLVLVGCYAVVRWLHLVLYRLAAGDDAGLRRQIRLMFAVSTIDVAVLGAAAAFTDGWTQTALWAFALGIDLTATLLLARTGGWRINSAAHWTERHGLVIIIALGESIVSIGVGVSELPISWPIIAASAVGIAVAVALWWAYFDAVALAAEHVLAHTRGDHRVQLATVGYTYLHLPLVAGILLVALGMKKVLSYVAGADGHTLTDALHGPPLYALYGGVALYLLGHGAFGKRVLGTLKPLRLTAATILVLLIPVAEHVPALAALALLAAVLGTLVVSETILYSEARRELREAH
jgi:low temperature requirement protein LtrA